jgi:hypothetical protein
MFASKAGAYPRVEHFAKNVSANAKTVFAKMSNKIYYSRMPIVHWLEINILMFFHSE